jgi:hypothetical protein
LFKRKKNGVGEFKEFDCELKVYNLALRRLHFERDYLGEVFTKEFDCLDVNMDQVNIQNMSSFVTLSQRNSFEWYFFWGEITTSGQKEVFMCLLGTGYFKVEIKIFEMMGSIVESIENVKMVYFNREEGKALGLLDSGKEILIFEIVLDFGEANRRRDLSQRFRFGVDTSQCYWSKDFGDGKMMESKYH